MSSTRAAQPAQTPRTAKPAAKHATPATRSRTLARPGSPEQLLQLQRQYGNRAAQRLIQRAPAEQSQPAAAVGLAGGVVEGDLQNQINSARGGGQPLAQAVGSQIGGALGADFSAVKVHTDATADNLNRSLSAQAFTLGSDVFFSQGAYSPGTASGQQLLAHELTHVVQQGAAPSARAAQGPAAIQRYTTIQPQESTTTKTAFQSTLTGDAVAGYQVSYKPVNVAAQPLNLSASGELAIYSSTASVTSFFISPAALAESNANLERTKSTVRLKPTGGSVLVQRAPEAPPVRLVEVDADLTAYQTTAWQTDTFFTQCKKFVQHTNPKVSGYEEAFRNDMPDTITDDEREAMDDTLRDLQLAAGDAFQIAAVGETKAGWNEHYAAIVAVDGEDHVTLENFNRDAEARDMMDADKAEMAGNIREAIDALRADLAQSSVTNIKNNQVMKRQLARLTQQLAIYTNVMQTKGGRDTTATTHYFKMFGPARLQQSFFEANLGDMQSGVSKLKVNRGGPAGERAAVNAEKQIGI